MRFSRYIFFNFLPVFFGSILFFVLLLELVDLFPLVFDFLRNKVGFKDILSLQALFIPRAITLSLPLSIIFAISFTLGRLGNKFELLAAFSLGISLLQMVRLVLLFSALVGIGGFFLQEFVAIPLLKAKTELTNSLLSRPSSHINRLATVTDTRNNLIYKIGLFEQNKGLITDLVIVHMSPEGKMLEVYEASEANFVEGTWQLRKVRKITDIQGKTEADYLETFTDKSFNLNPAAFEGPKDSFETLTWQEAIALINQKLATGQSARIEEGKLSERISFAFTPAIVALLAIVVGRRSRKALLLVSLSLSLGLAVSYYVIQIITVQLGNEHILDPVFSAWIAVILFGGSGSYMLYRTESRR